MNPHRNDRPSSCFLSCAGDTTETSSLRPRGSPQRQGEGSGGRVATTGLSLRISHMMRGVSVFSDETLTYIQGRIDRALLRDKQSHGDDDSAPTETESAAAKEDEKDENCHRVKRTNQTGATEATEDRANKEEDEDEDDEVDNWAETAIAFTTLDFGYELRRDRRSMDRSRESSRQRRQQQQTETREEEGAAHSSLIQPHAQAPRRQSLAILLESTRRREEAAAASRGRDNSGGEEGSGGDEDGRSTQRQQTHAQHSPLIPPQMQPQLRRSSAPHSFSSAPSPLVGKHITKGGEEMHQHHHHRRPERRRSVQRRNSATAA